MVMNKTKGNMYGFVTHTKNYIKGKCSHNCDYCYMKVWKQKPLHLDEKEFKEDLGKDNFIFVGSSTDMFAEDVPDEWIKKVLTHCRKFDNTYLFQTKNPLKLWAFISELPKKTIVGTTAETNRQQSISKAPEVKERLDMIANRTYSVMVTLEPLLDFDLEPFVKMIKECRPKWVNIGADSKGHKLPEPKPEKIGALINELENFTEVKLKPNLERIYTPKAKITHEGGK